MKKNILDFQIKVGVDDDNESIKATSLKMEMKYSNSKDKVKMPPTKIS
ncbi:hypothetical protein [Miniphocaeibacter halophilus]|uniref:Uncharacterized protein n=1 Tax=Miniphocaeibacter halophilus TaxID=2931922 RepID=A0AC61MPN1_9FIRM|nr:hypothetical protein [Miniphocaeibacter halophilus]QQK07108.1 hypothetical protein JFY71_07165 [Miniphocaeibacter halophilus]